MIKTFSALTLSLSLLSIPIFSRDAAAQDTQSYFVVTNDGSSYQGQLVENVVGQHVTIRLITGETRTFQASEVRSQGASATASAVIVTPQAPILGLPGGPPITYTGPDAVQIHITKSNNSEGTLLMETASGWQPACTMPCTTTVDPKINYKLHNSDPFRFPAGPPLDLIADTSGRHVFSAIGWTLITVSLVSIVPAILIQANVFSGDQNAQTPAEQRAQQSQQNTNLNIGFVIDGIAAAMFTTGIILLCIRPSTTLTTTNGQRLVKLSVPLTKTLALTPAGLSF